MHFESIPHSAISDWNCNHNFMQPNSSCTSFLAVSRSSAARPHEISQVHIFLTIVRSIPLSSSRKLNSGMVRANAPITLERFFVPSHAFKVEMISSRSLSAVVSSECNAATWFFIAIMKLLLGYSPIFYLQNYSIRAFAYLNYTILCQ